MVNTGGVSCYLAAFHFLKWHLFKELSFRMGFVTSLSVLFSSLSSKTGFLLMVVATFCFPTMDVMAKYLLQSQPVMQVVWARYTGQFILILCLFAPRLKGVARTRHPHLQIARSAALFGGTCFSFLACFIWIRGRHLPFLWWRRY